MSYQEQLLTAQNTVELALKSKTNRQLHHLMCRLPENNNSAIHSLVNNLQLGAWFDYLLLSLDFKVYDELLEIAVRREQIEAKSMEAVM